MCVQDLDDALHVKEMAEGTDTGPLEYHMKNPHMHVLCMCRCV